MTRVSKGIQNGEKWDRVILDNGIEGYVSQDYLKEVENSTSYYVNFDENLMVENNEISSINCTVGEFNSLVDTNLKIEIYNSKNNLLGQDKLIGTGSKLILKDENNNTRYEYEFLKYGDVNGDGAINSLDVLVLQKYILEIKPLSGVFLKAGNISKNGKLPSSLDVLKIQKHLLEIKYIEQ